MTTPYSTLPSRHPTHCYSTPPHTATQHHNHYLTQPHSTFTIQNATSPYATLPLHRNTTKHHYTPPTRYQMLRYITSSSLHFTQRYLTNTNEPKQDIITLLHCTLLNDTLPIPYNTQPNFTTTLLYATQPRPEQCRS